MQLTGAQVRQVLEEGANSTLTQSTNTVDTGINLAETVLHCLANN